MNKEKAKALLNRHENGELNKEEKLRLNEWYLQEVLNSRETLTDEALNDSYAFLRERLPLSNPNKFRLWQRIVAAAAVAAIVFGIWFFSDLRRPDPSASLSLSGGNDVAPGKNKATLTLASGRVIALDTSRTSVVVADSVKAMTMLTASTPRGGTYQVILPDGTKVWLNAASSIKFPSRFVHNEREVSLEGEGYFEVAKDTARPFIVKSAGQEVEVLGTDFNINAYGDESASKTTLVEGSVRVSSTAEQKEVVLKPGEQSINTGEAIKLTEADIAEAVAWKDGYFRFNNENIAVVMRQLSRWYNVEIKYEGGVPNSAFTGKISRNKNISQILKALRSTGKINFKIEGRKIIVTP